MTDIEKFVFEVGRRALKPDPYLSVSEWADQNRFLSQVASAEPGPWRTSRTPYLRDIMDALSTGSPYERVVFQKGAQIGATEMGLNFCGYIIDQAPGPALYVMPTVDMAKDASKTRLDPLIENCPSIREKIQEPRSRDAGNTTLLKEFPGGYIAMTGANSPAALRSKPIKYLFLDEIDAYPGDVGGEGDPIKLAMARTRTFSRRKIFMASTPTIAGRSRIEAEFEESDRRRYYVPCPHCGGFQVLKWTRVKWEPGRPDGAWYECEHCEERIVNSDKTFMLAHGEWRSDVKDYRGRVAGFHLSSLYSPVGWTSWGELATMFIEAKNNTDLLKVFVNTCLGECWEERGDAPEWQELYYRREPYAIGQVPDGGLVLVAGADVQKDRIEVEVVAFGRNRESWSVDYRVFPGQTDDLNSEPWARLDAMLLESFIHESGAVLQIRCLAVDTGYNTQVVYNWCRKYPVGRVMPVKGQDSLSVMIAQPKAVDVVVDGKKKANALKLWSIGVSIIKSEIYGLLRLPRPLDGQPISPGYIHFPEYGEEWFKQLTAEHLLIRESKGKKIFEWEKSRERNEALDCRVYARAASALLQIDRYSDQHWDRLAEAIGALPKDNPPAVPVATKATTAPEPARPAPAPPQVAPSRKARRVISSGIRI